MDYGVELAALEPLGQVGRGDEVGEPALLQIAPLAVRSERVVDHDIGLPGLIQVGDDVRPDESRSAGHQQHLGARSFARAYFDWIDILQAVIARLDPKSGLPDF